MQRYVLILLVSVSMAVALAVGSFAWQAAQFDHGSAAILGADPAVGVAFYAGLNRALAGEPDGEFQALVTDDFVDHADGERVPGALLDELTALGHTFPGIQLKVTDIRPSGDDLIVHVVPIVPEPGQIAGLSLTPEGLTGGIEVLHVRRGQVSERWAGTLPSLSATGFDDTAHSFYRSMKLSTSLYRIELQPGSRLSWRADELAVAMVEWGTLAVTIEKPNEIERPVTETVTVAAGEAVSIPRDGRLRLRSTSPEGATLLLFTAYDVSASDPRHFQLEGGAMSTMLWTSPAPFVVLKTTRVQVGRIEIRGAGEVSLAAAPGMEIVAVVQGEPVGVAVQDGRLLQRDAMYAIVPVESPMALGPGDAVQISQASGFDLETTSGDGVPIWLVTIGPIDAGTEYDGLPSGSSGRWR
jgi:hypothetical protein